MGKNGIFVMLLIAVITLALQPSLVNYSYAGTITLGEICDNGVDDNGNGLIDLDDPQCSPIILKPVPGALPELPGFNPDPVPLVGDFKCYNAFADDPPKPADLHDQFIDEWIYNPEDVIEVCNYIDKFPGDNFPPSTPPQIPLQHYKVYELDFNDLVQDDFLLKDQWGVTRHNNIISTELWVPQTKLHSNACPPDFPFDPEDFRCESPAQPPTGCPPPGTPFVTNTCQFFYCFETFGLGAIYDFINNQCASAAQGPLGPVDCGASGYTQVPGTDSCEFVLPPLGCPQGGTLDGDVCWIDVIPNWVFPQVTENHWKCYDVEPRVPDVPFSVTTFDPNFNPIDFPVTSEVFALTQICAPVEKSITLPTGQVITFGDSTIEDHLTCYDTFAINPIFNGENDDVTYIGQFGPHTFPIIDEEKQICLVATKIHIPEPSIGGSFIPIESNALLLLAAQTTASWIIPVLVSAVGIGIVLARKISSNKE